MSLNYVACLFLIRVLLTGLATQSLADIPHDSKETYPSSQSCICLLWWSAKFSARLLPTMHHTRKTKRSFKELNKVQWVPCIPNKETRSLQLLRPNQVKFYIKKVFRNKMFHVSFPLTRYCILGQMKANLASNNSDMKTRQTVGSNRYPEAYNNIKHVYQEACFCYVQTL